MNWTEDELRRILAGNPSLRVQEYRRKKTRQLHTIQRPGFDSQAEARYYDRHILPGLQTGVIISCEVHKTFEVAEAVEHCGRRYKNREYTPDFFVEYRDGSVDVVEIKGKEVKRLQRDYPLRRQLFILKYCVPNKWKFIEVRAEEI